MEQESRGVLRGRCRQVKPPPAHAGPSKCMLWSQILLLGVKFLDTVLRCCQAHRAHHRSRRTPRAVIGPRCNIMCNDASARLGVYSVVYEQFM